MLPVDKEALQWLRTIRQTLIIRKVRVSETVKYPLSEEGWRDARRAKGMKTAEASTPEDVITRELARSSRVAIRFLRKRGLSLHDRQDILHDALLWCLEHKDNYSLTTTLETWFINAVRDAYKRLKRHRERILYYNSVTDNAQEIDDGTIQQDD